MDHRISRVFVSLVVGLAAASTASAASHSTSQAAPHAAIASAAKLSGAIKHVVVIYQENHSFDNVLGQLCVIDRRCDGATTGMTHDGRTLTLGPATDVVPVVGHAARNQTLAENGGAMNGFDLVTGCTAANNYACYTAFQPSQIPNLAALARQYAISDRSFELSSVPSWGAHMELVSSQLDGFTGDNPTPARGVPPLTGWGCESHKDAQWRSGPGRFQYEPSCIPAPDGRGPYRPSPVAWVPTIMDRMDAAAIPWKLYAATGGASTWAICPTFADCQYTAQRNNVVKPSTILNDASAGTLPAFSILLPDGPLGRTSQHNSTSMTVGDNWIGQVVTALQQGPEWSSTAVFITYDDCGCFYDHVPPPTGNGIRVPTVIVSPFAKAAFTDSTVAASADSILAFTEHVFGLAPLGTGDAAAYDYANSFTTTLNTTPTALRQYPVPQRSLDQVTAAPGDPNDPT